MQCGTLEAGAEHGCTGVGTDDGTAQAVRGVRVLAVRSRCAGGVGVHRGSPAEPDEGAEQTRAGRPGRSVGRRVHAVEKATDGRSPGSAATRRMGDLLSMRATGAAGLGRRAGGRSASPTPAASRPTHAGGWQQLAQGAATAGRRTTPTSATRFAASAGGKHWIRYAYEDLADAAGGTGDDLRDSCASPPRPAVEAPAGLRRRRRAGRRRARGATTHYVGHGGRGRPSPTAPSASSSCQAGVAHRARSTSGSTTEPAGQEGRAGATGEVLTAAYKTTSAAKAAKVRRRSRCRPPWAAAEPWRRPESCGGTRRDGHEHEGLRDQGRADRPEQIRIVWLNNAMFIGGGAAAAKDDGRQAAGSSRPRPRPGRRRAARRSLGAAGTGRQNPAQSSPPSSPASEDVKQARHRRTSTASRPRTTRARSRSTSSARPSRTRAKALREQREQAS